MALLPSQSKIGNPRGKSTFVIYLRINDDNTVSNIGLLMNLLSYNFTKKESTVICILPFYDRTLCLSFCLVRLQNPWNSFLGDCSVIDQYLLDKPILSLKWFIPHYLNVLLRAIGQVIIFYYPLTCSIIAVSVSKIDI